MDTFCSYFNEKICHSCTLIDRSYSAQLAAKSSKLQEALAHLGEYQLLPVVSSETVGFRNKAKLIVTGTTQDPIIGLTGTSDIDQGRDIRECPLHHSLINKIINDLPIFIRQANLTPYLIKEKKGELKGVILYYSQESQSAYLRFVLRSKESVDRIRKNIANLTGIHPYLKCISVNIQPVAHAILEGTEEIFIGQEDSIPHAMDGVEMSLHPQGFVQTNQAVATRLYQTAALWVKEVGAKKFVELFSGQGAFSFFIQKYVDTALGIEINEDAVARANRTATTLGLNHLRFIASDAALVEKELISAQAEMLLVNPPRRGLSTSLTLIKNNPSPYMIYSSCNVITLAQDLTALKDIYRPQKVQLFDMFPHTEHFETLVLLKAIADVG
jgi:23S rRNA (uracil747-C5)-methyltransferase